MKEIPFSPPKLKSFEKEKVSKFDEAADVKAAFAKEKHPKMMKSPMLKQLARHLTKKKHPKLMKSPMLKQLAYY